MLIFRFVTGQKLFAHAFSGLVRSGIVLMHSMENIVVATPSQLADHIQMTSGFSFGALRFLVIVEADRVMVDVQNDWFNNVENAVYTAGCE